jgi:uncharacterized protein (TIGR00661 family)
MPFPRKLRILIAPLDWGLGHTTRCIPVIDALQKEGVEVVIAGNKVQESVLLAEFPGCTFLPLEGYGVVYSRKRKGFLLKMMQQLPRIASVVKRENRWLQEVIVQERIDGVISDNRFGLFSKKVPCVFITHQLRIKTGLGNRVDWVSQTFNYRYINRFSRVWVPDFEGPRNLAGMLSHSSRIPAAEVSYVGALTRVNGEGPGRKGDQVVFIFSGPEPQRSIFEQEVFKQLKGLTQPVVIIRGTPLLQNLPSVNNAILYNHLPAKEMQEVMRSAALIVCRSGYSSVMDINALRQKSVLVPTPGQTEQEYLAQYLMEQRFAISADQHNFELQQVIEKAATFPYDGFIETNPALLQKAIRLFLQDCGRRR